MRPVHWLVLLFGNDVIPLEILGVSSGKTTRGHRFHHPEEITIASPQSYAKQLMDDGYVVVDMSERQEIIRQQVVDLGEKLEIGRASCRERV